MTVNEFILKHEMDIDSFIAIDANGEDINFFIDTDIYNAHVLKVEMESKYTALLYTDFIRG